MGDVIDLTTKDVTKSTPKEAVSLASFLETYLRQNKIEELLVCLKLSDGDIELFRTDNISIKDRSYIVQLIQSDIYDELTDTVDINLEPDL